MVPTTSSTSGSSLRDLHTVAAASVPFLVGGFAILELPIRWGSGSGSGFPGAQTGVVLACFGLGYGLAQIPSSLVTQRLGAAPTLRLALLSVLVWPLTLASSAAVIAVGRFLFGLLLGLTFSAGLMLIRQRVTRERQAVAVAAFSSSWAVGLVAAALLGASTVDTAILLAAMLCLGLLALAGLRLSEGSESEIRRRRITLRASFDLTAARVMLIVVSAGLMGQVALTTWGPRAASEGAGVGVAAVGIVVAVGLAAGSFIGSSVSGLRSSGTIVALSPVLTGVMLALFAFAGDSPSVTLLLICCVSTASLINFAPGMARIFREVPRATQAMTTGVINGVGWIVSAAAPIFLGLLTTGSAPPQSAWLVLAAVSCLAGLAAFAVDQGRL